MGGGAMVPQTGLRGGGVLVPVVGPGGAGKSMLVAAAQRTYLGNPSVAFSAPLATRLAGVPPRATDVSLGEFEALEAAGAFSATWRARERAFGLPREIDADLGAGRIVVFESGTTVLRRLRRQHRRIHAVYVTAAREILVARLTAATGTGAAWVRERLAAEDQFSMPEPPVTVIDNSGSPAEAIDEFLGVLAAYVPVD